MNLMNIGLNLFGPKKALYYDFEGTLGKLKSIGFNSLEICVSFGDNEWQKKWKLPPELLQRIQESTGGIWDYRKAGDKIKAVRKLGFHVDSAHLMFGIVEGPETIQKFLPEITEFGQTNQIQYFVISLMKGLKEIREYVPALNRMAEELNRVGIRLVYHNHDMECVPEENTTALDFLLEQCPLLKLELDVGWAKFAGASPIELMKKNKDRLVLLHLKDIRADASQKTRNRCFTAIGEGSIPLKEILEEAGESYIAEHGIIIDQDDSLNDLLEDLTIGVKHIMECQPCGG